MGLHGKRLREQQPQTTNKNHDPDRHDTDIQAKPTVAGQPTHATETRDDDDTPLILSPPVES